MTKATAQAEFTCIDFLRHGECEGGEIFRGSGSDVALTDQGWQQMRDCGAGYGWLGLHYYLAAAALSALCH